MMERHILVTGGAGYIGSLLTAELLRAGHYVTVVDNLLFGGESLVSFLHHPNFHFRKADVTEPRAIREAVKGDWRKPDAIVHLAAIVGFPACQAVGPQVAWKYNVEATKTVFGQASDLGVGRFVFASTYSNYGLSPDGEPVRLLFLIASPKKTNLDYLQALSTLVRVIRDCSLRENLLSALDAEEIEKNIRSAFTFSLERVACSSAT